MAVAATRVERVQLYSPVARCTRAKSMACLYSECHVTQESQRAKELNNADSYDSTIPSLIALCDRQIAATSKDQLVAATSSGEQSSPV